jgi:hypothetical protein
MINKKQLTELVITPTLKEIPRGYSNEAVMAIQMIIAHESNGGQFLAQNGGPALGIIQMEPFTHDDTWAHGDTIQKNAERLKIVTRGTGIKSAPSPTRLIYDLRYNVFMARQRLFMFDEPLLNNAYDMAIYLKKYWNAGGKASVEKYHADYALWK